MAKLNEQTFKKEMTSGQLANLYLIYGEEKLLVKKYTELLINKAAGKTPSDFDYIRLNSDSSLEEIFSSCEQLPVFAERKTVSVSDYNFESLNESDLKLLEEYLQDISPSTVIVFTMPTLETQNKKGSKFGRIISAAEKYGSALELNRMGDIILEKQLMSWAEKGGCTISRINASKVIRLSGTDLTVLKNEMDKLIAYADGKEITEEMIGLLTVKNSEVRIYALSDSISKNDFNAAYRNLYALFEQNERPEIILSTLSSIYIDMYRMRAASESGKTVKDVASDFKYGKRDFVLKNASANSARYSTKALREILDIILETDVGIKSKPSDNKILLETLVAKLFVASARS